MKRWFVIVLNLGLALVFSSDSCAKVISSTDVESSRAHIRFSPEAESLIRAAAKAEQSRDWPAVAENYQKALDLYPQYLIKQSVLSDNGQANVVDDLYWGVQYFCQNALVKLPAEGRKAYRGMFDSLARHAFDNAVKGRLDIERLEQLVLRYGLTESGRQSLVILMRWCLERGESHKALGYYRELKRIYPEYVKNFPEAGIIDKAGAGKTSDVEWPMYAGDNTRSRIAAIKSAEKPDKGYAFTWAGYFKLPIDIVNLYRSPLNNPNIYYTVVPQESIPYFPVANNGLLYLPTGSGIYAFDLPESKDGKVPSEMKVKWKVELKPEVKKKDGTPGRIFQEERIINTASLSADGKRLYVPLIDSFEEYEERLGYLDVKYPFPRRLLFCFDTATAKVIWKSDKMPRLNGGDDFFADVIFPVAPAEDNNVLYAAGIRMPSQIDIPEHYLIALNAKTGVAYFKTFIGSGILETNLFNNPSREPIASAVTVDADNIYYCSHMGIITAVDKYTGMIKWLKKYEEYRIPTTWPDPTPPHLPLRWINNPIIYLNDTSFARAKGQVLVTAIDSPFLYLLSAESGREMWSWDGDNDSLGNVRYMLGIKDGYLVLSGESGLACLNLNKAGAVEWEVRGRKFGGKGFLADDKIYISENYTLLEIALKTGKLVSLNTLQGKDDAQPAANLFIAGDCLIRNSIGQVNLYRIENKREVIDEQKK